jgi:galactonate dehydratase
MLDAISGVDLALWDLAGKLAGQPVSRLIRPDAKASVPAYLSGTSGATVEERAAFAKTYQEQGIGLVKLYFESRWEDLLHLADRLPNGLRFAVDALWHLPPASAAAMGADLDRRTARWLECPFYPEQIEEHEALAARITTPIALGESYRTVAELKPFATLASILQPDLGRSGLTESLRIASAYQREIIPHVSIAMGPQIAAAVHFAAVADRCALCEFNPSVLEMANRFLREPIRMEDGHYLVPAGPGLGIEWNSAFDKLV